ncbi:hypothetical protein [Streptomyces sp. NPDC060188]|uniref:hypothetical protein n=1 Tax=Streptomyces sp. NPDC060188 TaxID=3347068 RepID=UPI00366324DE
MALSPDWDWEALHDRLLSLATVAHLIDSMRPSGSTRLISLERLCKDTAEASEMARFVLARERGGEDWWRSETTKR